MMPAQSEMGSVRPIRLPIMDLRQWVIWRYEEKPGRPKPTKVLYQAERPGLHASTTKALTWATYDAAQEARIHGDGIGFVFAEDDDYVGIDLDQCINDAGELTDWAREIVDLMNSYTEYSPSHRGLHIFVRAVLPGGGRKRGHLEIYDRGRYFTFTGDHFPGTPEEIVERQAEIDSLYASAEPEGRTEYHDPPPPLRLDDVEIIRRARNAKNGAKFQSLWSGDISGYPSQSEAEQALCNMLAFWVGKDADAIDRLFRQSGLYRPKWDERHYGDGRTYGQGTAQKAAHSVRDTYSPGKATQRATGAAEQPPDNVDPETGEVRGLLWMTAKEIAEKTPEEPEWVVPGLLARGVITELSAKIKVGKTTFWGAMVAAILRGEPFLGLPTTITPIVLLTEERESSVRALLGRVGLEHEDRLHILQRYLTRGMEWPAIVEEAILYAHKVRAGLLIIDTLPDWAGITGDAENNAGDALAAMAPLQTAAATGLAVLPVRHDRKGGGEIGDSARGSSAFGGAVDIILGLRRADSPGHENRRILMGVGRFDGIPEELTIELREGVYVSLGKGSDVERQEAKESVFVMLPEYGERGLTIDELVDEIGEDKRATVNRVIKEGLKAGQIQRSKGYGQSGRKYGHTKAPANEFFSPRTPEKFVDSRVPALVDSAPLPPGAISGPEGGAVKAPVETQANEFFRGRSLYEKFIQEPPENDPADDNDMEEIDL